MVFSDSGSCCIDFNQQLFLRAPLWNSPARISTLYPKFYLRVFIRVWHRSAKWQGRILCVYWFPYPHFFLIMFVSNTSKSLCLLTLSLTPSGEAYWAASSVVFEMFLHFWPRFSGTKVFLSTTSLMPGFYPWLLHTGGSPAAQIPMLPSHPYPSSGGFGSPHTPVAQAGEGPGSCCSSPGHRSRGRKAKRGQLLCSPITPVPRERLHPPHRVSKGTEQSKPGGGKVP